MAKTRKGVLFLGCVSSEAWAAISSAFASLDPILQTHAQTAIDEPFASLTGAARQQQHAYVASES